jgi:hypothetical protein
MSQSPKRICIVTAGHLATCPRMVKAADALTEAGHQVRVVSADYLPWAHDADAVLRQTRHWAWNPFDYDKRRKPVRYYQTGLRSRFARAVAKAVSPEKLGLGWAARAFCRSHPELLKLVLAEPADLIYGGTSGGLAVAFQAAKRMGVPYALDLEDFHSAEQVDSEAARLAHRLIENIERAILPGAAFLTAGSEAVGTAYEEKYHVKPLPVLNTFPLPKQAPKFEVSPPGSLKLYWFSQTIGSDRGLEDAVMAMGLANIPGELHLRGVAVAGYVETLNGLAEKAAPRLKIFIHSPAAPDKMIELAGDYEVGLALEQATPLNRNLSLTNKAFTYLPAGLAVVFTDTAGQRPLAGSLAESALIYKPGELESLARGLKAWADHKDALLNARKAAWQAAVQRWHWDHPLEKGRLQAAVANVF